MAAGSVDSNVTFTIPGVLLAVTESAVSGLVWSVSKSFATRISSTSPLAFGPA